MSIPILNVLFLEDQKETDGFLVKRQVRSVADVKVVTNRIEYQRALNERRWHVILLDFSLPDIRGPEAIQLAKAVHPTTPIIIVTGSVTEKEANEACSFGAKRYFQKNNLEDLSKAITEVHEEFQKVELEIKDNRIHLLGETLAGFTHDLNNVLGPMVGGPGIVRGLLAPHLEHLPEETAENISRLLDTMESSGARGADMSRQLTAFVRGSNGSAFKSIAPEYLLSELGSMMRDTFPKTIRILTHTHDGTSLVRCDPTQIIQTLLNLCTNARDAMAPSGGQLDIIAQNATLTKEPLVGDYVMIRVRDTGPGIPEDVLPRIFEPMFTTKERGKGTGLGLSMALKIVREIHGGTIDVRTVTSGTTGTSFFVYLPAAKTETHSESMNRIFEFDGDNRTVLIVDDEAHMRFIMGMTLKDANYKAVEVGSAMEALSFFRSSTKVDLLLSDVSMPLMSGIELLTALRAQGFSLPVVFMTGQPEAEIEEFDPRPDALLSKLAKRHEILTTIKNVLDGVGSRA